MEKRIPYCASNCKSCSCKDCKKPFETWIFNKPGTIEIMQGFNGRCEECYKKHEKS